jgi:hypothetical protein
MTIVTITRISPNSYAVGNVDVPGSTAEAYQLPAGYSVDADTIRDANGEACAIEPTHYGTVRLRSSAGERRLATDWYHRPAGGTPLRDAATAAAKDAALRQTEALWHEEFVVETNAGTYSATEALRAVGTSDPAFADYQVLERVGDGRRRRVGANPTHAPGYARYMHRAISEARAKLAKA